MKYLCLIAAEKVMEQMEPDFAAKHFEEYREFTEAIRIGARIPPARKGTIEIRPVLEIPSLPLPTHPLASIKAVVESRSQEQPRGAPPTGGKGS